jgi:microcystin-dependent protein
MDIYMGMIIAVPFDYAPDGFSICAGQALPIGQYQALYSLLGIRYGGNGSSSFNLPDLRGRAVVGAFAPGPTAPVASYPLAQAGGSVTGAVNGVFPHSHVATSSIALDGFSASGTVNIPVTASFTDQSVNVSGSLAASKDIGTDEQPFAGATLGDPNPGNQKMYLASPTDPAKTVQLATIPSTGKLSATSTGSAQGTISLQVSAGSASSSVTVQPAGAGAVVSTVSPFLALNNIIATIGLYPVRPS